MMRARIATVAVGACLLIGGCGGDDDATTSATKPAPASAPAKADITIDIASFKFAPKAARVAAGGSVTWTNTDKAGHNAENSGQPGPEQFDTGRLEQKDTKRIRFDKPGVYTYYCVYHRFMKATLTVDT